MLLNVLGYVRRLMLGQNAQQRAQFQPPTLSWYTMPTVTHCIKPYNRNCWLQRMHIHIYGTHNRLGNPQSSDFQTQKPRVAALQTAQNLNDRLNFRPPHIKYIYVDYRGIKHAVKRRLHSTKYYRTIAAGI